MALDVVDFKVPEEWVTHGATRPAIVLRRNGDDGTADLLVFHHPEDRQANVSEVQLRVPADRFTADAAENPPQAAGDGPQAPPEPRHGMQAGRSPEGNGEASKLV